MSLLLRENHISIRLEEGLTNFHYFWLRDNCHCAECYHPETKQRLVSVEYDQDLVPSGADSFPGKLQITWSDKHVSEWSWLWLKSHSYWPVLDPAKKGLDRGLDPPRTLWNVSSLAKPTVDFHEVMQDESSVGEWCMKIHTFGLCFVENTPVSPEATQALIERIAFIRETHYGAFWDFTADLSVNDTAYSDIAIPLHTDGTYFTDPPGLQLFHLLKHDGEGGITTLCDSFQAASILKEQYPLYYEILSTVGVPTHSAGDVFVQPSFPRPILNLDDKGNLIQTRWNASDRSTMRIDPELMERFYAAIQKWTEIIESPENELYHKLVPGECLIFDNWRVLHSRRTAFTGERRMCGGYINRDDFMSRLKLLNFEKNDLLESL